MNNVVAKVSVALGCVVALITIITTYDQTGFDRPVWRSEHLEVEQVAYINREEFLEDRIQRLTARIFEFQRELAAQGYPETEVQTEYRLLLQRQIERDKRELSEVRSKKHQ